jgi:hypothetical protein
VVLGLSTIKKEKKLLNKNCPIVPKKKWNGGELM